VRLDRHDDGVFEDIVPHYKVYSFVYVFDAFNRILAVVQRLGLQYLYVREIYGMASSAATVAGFGGIVVEVVQLYVHSVLDNHKVVYVFDIRLIC